ncbi:40S ribosomal protein S11 [Plecturocebus cupreus]
MQKISVICQDYFHSICKYSSFKKRPKNTFVHLSPCFRDVQTSSLITAGADYFHKEKTRQTVEGDGQEKADAKPDHPERKRLGPGLTLHGLREDELQVFFGPMLRVLHQLIDAVSPVQARLPALPGQRYLPPALHDDSVLVARKATVY